MSQKTIRHNRNNKYTTEKQFKRHLFVKALTQVVIPLDENRAMLSSKSMPPTPITSIWSAGLLSVLKQEFNIRKIQ